MILVCFPVRKSSATMSRIKSEGVAISAVLFILSLRNYRRTYNSTNFARRIWVVHASRVYRQSGSDRLRPRNRGLFRKIVLARRQKSEPDWHYTQDACAT